MNDSQRILVIGDIMLDQYVSGKVTRISPEAPVPVVKVEKEWNTLGGAGNVAANVASLGQKPILVGLVGNDVAGQTVVSACEAAGIDAKMILSEQPTIVKTRVVSGQQIVRFDKEEEFVWSDEQMAQFQGILEQTVPECSLILLSDYAKGTLSDKVLESVFNLALEHGKRVLIDPKRQDWSAYSGAHLVTPNLVELRMTEAGNGVDNEDNQVINACNALRNQFGIENIVATRSSYGMSVVSESGILNVPTRALEVFDVSGAGDTVLAALGVSLAQGKTVSESAVLANAAAGIVVSKRGTATVSATELQQFLKRGSKLISREDLKEFYNQNKDRKVVFTNGCFDVLHQGHRKLLEEARKLGDVLVVGVNSNASIARLKGKDRPINDSVMRVDALSALPMVDAVIEFEEDTPYELIEQLRPAVIVKGGDYKAEEVVGGQLAQQVVIIPLVEGTSTTQLLS